MSVFIIITLIVLVFVIIYQIGKASEYAVVLRGEEKVKAQANRAISVLLLVMFALGIWGIWECNEMFKGKMLPVAACKTGENYDMMFNVTVTVTGIVFFLRSSCSFGFALSTAPAINVHRSISHTITNWRSSGQPFRQLQWLSW